MPKMGIRPSLTEAAMSRGLPLLLISLGVGVAGLASAYDFSVDPTSPEVTQLRYASNDVIQQNGAAVSLFAASLGLGTDELDGFSFGKDLLRPAGPNYFVSLQFSVSRATTGAGGAVSKQVTGNGAAGDKFGLLILRNGRTVGPFLESDAPNHQLTPLPPSQSEIDGLSYPAGTRNRVFYTVGRGGVKAPSDVWYVEEPGVTAPVLYATAAQLGLAPGDNVDCLMVKDGGALGVLDSSDIVNVSLDTASPTRAAAPSGGTDNILQVFPLPLTVAIPYTKLDITSATTEEIDACTAYDPGPDGKEIVTAHPATSFGLLSSELDAAGPMQPFYIGTQTGIIANRGYYTSLGPGLATDPPTELGIAALFLFDSDLHVVKGGGFPWDRGTSLIDTTNNKQSFHYLGLIGLGQTDTTVITDGDPIPDVAQPMMGFFRCGVTMIGMQPCFIATLRSAAFQPYWSAICRDGVGLWTQGKTFMSQGTMVGGKLISLLNSFDCSPDAGNANLTNCYGSARTSTSENVMLRVQATGVPGGPPIWGAPSILMDATTAAPGGSTFNDYGFQNAAGSVVFHGRTAAGGEGIYRYANGVVTRIADRTTPVPGGTGGNFTSFGDDVSNDEGAVTFIGISAGGRGIYTTLTGRLQKVAQVNDVIGGRTVSNLTLARDGASRSNVAFGARFSDGRESIVVKELPIPFDTANATERAVHVDVELDPDPALLGPDPRALLVGDLGTERLRGIWSSNGTTGTIKIPGSELSRLLALQFGVALGRGLSEWVITVDVASGAVLSSTASGTLANGPFGLDADTGGGPWTSPLLGPIAGASAGFETDAGGRKLFCSNAFSQIAGGACGAGIFGFPAPAAYDRSTGFAHLVGPLTLGDVVLWGFPGDQRWLEAIPGACPDIDSDGACDADDNCPNEPNPGQQDAGGIGAGSAPDGVGDACQCGDHSGNGVVTAADAVALQRSFLVPPTAARAPALCDVGPGAGCTLSDAVTLRRALLVPPTASLAASCEAAVR
jgi:hypothetical protein